MEAFTRLEQLGTWAYPRLLINERQWSLPNTPRQCEAVRIARYPVRLIRLFVNSSQYDLNDRPSRIIGDRVPQNVTLLQSRAPCLARRAISHESDPETGAALELCVRVLLLSYEHGSIIRRSTTDHVGVFLSTTAGLPL